MGRAPTWCDAASWIEADHRGAVRVSRSLGGAWEFSEDGQRPSGKRMPNPGLREKDITPLIAFINAERRVTSR
ncbi:MAG TPA: hypothetical protein VGC52_04290 [Gemmatimonadaceae bacterium]